MIQYTVNPDNVQSPYIRDNYKLTRAVWFALYAPDSGRHGALLADDVPDVYRRLFDAILEGTRGLARVALENGDALDLLDIVAKLPRPRLIPTRRLELPDNPDLAEALFGGLAATLEIAAEGVWPDAPAHTCDAKNAVGTVLTIRPLRTHAARIYNPTWRDCDGCLHARARRISHQALLEMAVHGIMFYRVMTEYDYKKWTARVRQFRRRAGAKTFYRAMPQGDGLVFVMATAGALAGPQVPFNRADLLNLIMTYCNTPDGYHVRGSHGFGGDWQRMKGDGREVAADKEEAKARGQRLKEYQKEKRAMGGGAVQRWTDSSLEEVAAATGGTIRDKSDRFSVKIPSKELYSRCEAGDIKLRDKRVTSLSQKKPKRKNCDKLVTAGAPPAAMVPLPLPAERDFDTQGGAPWPIYLP